MSADEAYAPYLSLLQRALLSRLFLQLSEVYSIVKIDNLNALVKPLKDAGIEGAFDEEQLQSYIMGCARRGELNIRVDHKDGSITFVDDPYVLTDEPSVNPETKTSTSSEGFVQPSMAEFVRTRLSRIATTLHKSLEIIEPKASLSPEEQAEKFKSLVAAADAERRALRLRRALVAKRRELLSELSVRKEKEETNRRAEISRREKEEEEKRRREDLRRKEQERARKEIESIKIDEAKKYAQSLVTKGILKANDVDVSVHHKSWKLFLLIIYSQKLENYDTEGLITIQVAQLEKEKKELNERLRVVSKRIDHIERAYRKEEHPLLAQDYERQQKTDREAFEASQKTRKESAKKAHQEDLATKVRLARMMNDFSARKEVLLAKKGEEFAKRKEAARKKIEEEKEKMRKAVVKAWEEEKHREEEEERLKREKEEEEQRLEEGSVKNLTLSISKLTRCRAESRGRATTERRRGQNRCKRRGETEGRGGTSRTSKEAGGRSSCRSRKSPETAAEGGGGRTTPTTTCRRKSGRESWFTAEAVCHTSTRDSRSSWW